jgi:hypothetical protein
MPVLCSAILLNGRAPYTVIASDLRGESYIPHAFLKSAYTNRDLFTLTWLLIIIIVFPIFENSAVGNILLVCLFSILLLSALYSVSDHPRQVAIGILLAIPILLSAWTNVFLPSRDTLIAEVIATAVFLTYILLAILKRVFAAREVTLTEIYRAVNVYIMIALTFGMLYLLIDFFLPGSFQFLYGERTMSALMYFSFGVLSIGGVGDIIATGPVVHSVVTIEMIIGVMYMAVFIGLLVNAHYSTRYSSRNTGDPVSEERETPPTQPARLPYFRSGGPATLVAAAVMLNLATSITMVAFHFPLFMDTWGTSLIVMTGGFWIGACAGVLYNLIMAYTFWGIPSALWAANSVLVAGATWFFWKRGWVDLIKPFMLCAAGILTGLVNTPLVLVNAALFNLPPSDGPIAIAQFLSGIFSSPALRDIVSECLIEIADKTLSLILAAVVALLLTDILQKYNPDRGE